MLIGEGTKDEVKRPKASSCHYKRFDKRNKNLFCLEQYELYEGFQRGWEVRVGGGKEDSNCTVSASVRMKSHSQQQGGVMLGTVLLMLYCIYTAEWREGWVDSGNRWAGKWPLLLPSTPYPPPSYYYTALMHTLFPHKVATTNPLLQCTLKAPILLSCTSKYFSYNATNPLPLALTPQH